MIPLRSTWLVGCFFGLLFSVSAQTDMRLLKAINSHETNFKNELFAATSNTDLMINIVAPATVFISGAFKKNKQLQRDGLFMAGTMLVNGTFVYVLKSVIKRERPFLTDPSIVKRSDGGHFSMPSGHTATAFNTATALCLVFPKWYVIVLAYSWATLVAYGRVYQGVHYPSDVAVGALVGTGTALASHFLYKRFMENRKVQNRNLAFSF